MRGADRLPINVAYRITVALSIVGAVFFGLLLRLWYLQILRGEYFRERSENNRTRVVYVPAPRGQIRDRNGKVLVRNRPSFNIDFVSEDSPDPKQTLTDLAILLGEPSEAFHDRLKHQTKRRGFEPKLILKDVSMDVVAKVSAKNYALPGIVINVVPAREYLYGSMAAHVLGYIREITKNQLESPRYPGYKLGDIIGQYGVEMKWEPYLQGNRGMQGVVVNARGLRISEKSYEPEIEGKNVTLTLDYEVQKAADDAMKDKKGAVVALDPNTGEILAMTSAPGFDPNAFVGQMSGQDWAALVTGKEKRLNNRAVQGAYPPGSVFKMVMAVAGLSEGVISPTERINCPGFMRVGRVFRCHKASGHGAVDLYEAIVKSCDVYFYTVGQRLGIDRIWEYATKFGFGQSTGLELVEENRGLIPSTAWKKSHFSNPEDQKWYPGETPSVAIGQGAVSVTPLQIARAFSVLVNGGKLYKPYLVKKIESTDGTFIDQDFKPQELGQVNLDPKIVKLVEGGLQGVVADPSGTGHRAALPKEYNITTAGKTGTAQVVALDSGASGEHLEDHAWFAGYAPADKPEIVVVVLVENGGHGGVASAPVFRQVLEAYFAKKLKLSGTPA